MTNVSAGRIDALQALRGLAALLVFVSHLQKELGRYGAGHVADLFGLTVLGQFGVDLFFVISGFVMVYVTAGSRRLDWSDFLTRRLIRVAPLYWIFTALALGVSFFLESAKHNNDLRAVYVASSFLFIPVQRISDEHFTPLLGVGWTLNYEILFYICFAGSLAASKRAPAALVLIAFPLMALVGFGITSDDPILWYWTRPIILEFVIGMLIGKIYLLGWRLTHLNGRLLGITGVAAWLFSCQLYQNPIDSSVRLVAWGWPAGLIVAAVLLRSRATQGKAVWPLSTWLGDISFSLYLSHMFAIRLVSIAAKAAGVDGTLGALTICIGGTIVSLLVADVCYRFLELPLTKALNSSRAPRQQTAT